jgi:hypothetical protein
VALVQTKPHIAVNDQKIGRARLGSNPNSPFILLQKIAKLSSSDNFSGFFFQYNSTTESLD